MDLFRDGIRLIPKERDLPVELDWQEGPLLIVLIRGGEVEHLRRGVFVLAKSDYLGESALAGLHILK